MNATVVYVILLVLSVAVGCAPAPYDRGPLDRAPASGERVRVLMQDGDRREVIGKFGLLDSTGTLRLYAPAAAVPLDEVRSIEISSGYEPYGPTGTIAGAIVGAVVGGVLSSTAKSKSPPPGQLEIIDSGTQAAIAVVAGGLAGALIGYVVARSIASERWVQVSLQALRTPRPEVEGR